MSDQAAKDLILGKTLHTLVEKHGLTSDEVAQIRLSHLFLAGKNPSINFTPEGSQDPKVVTLDMETHRALVNWLVNRPDSVSDFLFPGHGPEAITSAEVQEAIAKVEGLPSQSEQPAGPKPTVLPEVDVPIPEPGVDSSSRPVRPLSRPEMGAPPPGVGAAKASFAPPPMAPEEETVIGGPKPASGPKPPPVPPARPAAPPPSPPEPRTAPVSPSQPVPVTKKEEPASTPEPDLTMVSATKPEVKKEEETKADRPAAGPEEKEEKKVTPPPKKEGQVGRPAMAVKRDRPIAPMMVTQRPLWARFFIPGVVVIALLLCGGCLAGGWFAAQSESGSQLLASLGWSSDMTPGAGDTEATEEAVVFESAVPTPTLPSTSTSTAAPATNTPPPTDTATSTPPPTDTPTPAVTDTPTPTETPVPTDTSEAGEEAAAPTDTPTPGLKYDAPQLIEPKNDFAFIYGNTIVLQWNPVDLAPDEQYAVRLVYPYQGQPTYQGSNVKEPQWTVPLDLFGKIDGPENRYEWFVVIERVNDDGSATAVSPESEHRAFTWR